ncbi:hypothetical protein M409DRAFT_16223 [Zasmidium cellare ATCC 36951]|uniref:Cupin type-2 domain-containing protein n=1 Tax=Zasmidium cellare ATCC 36951 TaxID=1080233 RepID=A0A6A6D493_ZASCE|nr:uncharacterized protein M409DRAFT_16223 [Zasmidium cellare ATCC 36951]KAF2173953.1 hypothetical protein M409DRAFT_16223 [Zasmidium cellare ATCC 36951]
MASTTNTTTASVQPVDSKTQRKKSLLADLDTLNVAPLWAQMKRVNPPLPKPNAIPFVWRYDQLRPKLMQAGELISEQEAERRVLMLINPKTDIPCTTDTIFGGLQLVIPNETAPAHRHTAFAMRFIIEGTGGFTAVDGQRINMDRGDVILTPSWTWHDHGKDGSGPMIWLDGLDVPSFKHFPVHFVEHFEKARYPATTVEKAECPIVFPWAGMKGQLDGVVGTWATSRYLDSKGGEVSKTLGSAAERLDGGATSPARQETASIVYHVTEGSGQSEVGEQVITWKRGDTFCVPCWYKYTHHASPGERVYLYRFDDRPMIKALGFYRADSVEEIENV